MNDIISKLNQKSKEKFKLLKPNYYPVKKILVKSPLRIREILKNPLRNYQNKNLNSKEINKEKFNNKI
jgi:hypothetical protein